jgi:poly(A)-specific ribonuclease
MEVGRKTFHWELPRMLRALTTAHFVALDFELSGIQSKAIHKVKLSEKPLGGVQTLQQRYEETKEAAERYQILQVGLTVVKEDEEGGLLPIDRE